MQTTILLFNLAAVFVLFHTGRGSKLCTWSQRLIPKNATGDITLEVPIVYSYEMRCYENNSLVCLGLRPPDAPKDNRCGYTKENGRMKFRYRLFRKSASKTFFFCCGNRQWTRALTYIVDWRGASDVMF
ncbi:hypothetical protein SprV_0602082500 [Sparganum proliferum]